MIKKIKSKIPQSVKSIYHGLWLLFINKVNVISPGYATKILHFRTTGKWIDLKNPKDFNEKLQWLKLNEDAVLKAKCSDKYEIYNYIKENYDSSILNNLIAVYDSTDEIDWDSLPDKYVIKCTHGSGYNIVVKDKNKLDKDFAVKQINNWLKEKFGKRFLELHYDLIKPRIIVEEFIENKEGELPLDYKIFCFNGTAKLVLVCSERTDREESIRLDFFDLDWNRLNIGSKEYESSKEILKPSCFSEMVIHAEALSKPFTFVRVDFYDKDGEPLFGELTFTPTANMDTEYNNYGLSYLGGLLDIKN